jgi:competence protein ComEA
VRPEPTAGHGGTDRDAADDEDYDDADDTVDAPAWVSDRRAPRGRAWLSVIRADPGRSGGIALGAVGALAVLITIFTLIRNNPPPVASAKFPPVDMVSSTVPAPGPPTAENSDHSVVVSVVGLVQQPGLVTLDPGARVADAISAAGGPLNGADTVGLNLARHIVDGEQIVVGITTPAGLPAAIIGTLHAALAALLARPAFQQRLASQGMSSLPMSTGDYAAYIARDRGQWAELVRATGIRAD